MSISLPIEYATEIAGNGDGTIVITQKDEFNEVSTIYLSVHQFETIFNHSKHIVSEAWGKE